MTLFLYLLGCPTPCPVGDSPTLEVGTGEKRFTPVPEGGSVDAVFGRQGGFHYPISLRAEQINPEGAQVEVQGFFEGQLVFENTYDGDFKCRREEKQLEMVNLRFQPELPWDTSDTGNTGYQDLTVVGPVEIRCRLTEASGRVVETTTTWVVDP